MTRTERLTATILLLQGGRRTCEAVARELNVSRRTVIRDVQALMEMGVPVLSHGGPNGGYEIVREWTLAPLHLTGREALLLMLAVESLEKMADVPFSAERASLLAKLRSLLPPAQRARVEETLTRIGFEIPERTQRAPCLEALLEVTGSRTWVRIVYEGSPVVLRPDRLYADRGHWYVEGVSEGQSRTLRADRVEDVAPCDPPETHEEPLPYGHPSHPLVEVTLTAKGAKVVEREPHLGKLVAGPGPATLAFRCPPSELDWYARYFGGLGPDAAVAGPPELIEKIVGRAKEILGRYEPKIP